RRLDVVDDRGAWRTRENVRREQHQLPIRVDHVARRRDDAEPVAVAVESEPELAIALAEPAYQVLQVGGLRWIGMMIRKAPVDVAEEQGDVAAEPPVEVGRECAGNAVAAIDGDAHRPREMNVAGDAIEVCRCDVRGARGTAAARKVA